MARQGIPSNLEVSPIIAPGEAEAFADAT